MRALKRLVSLIAGIGLVGLFLVWIALRDSVIEAVSTGIASEVLLHGMALLVLSGGVSLVAVASRRGRNELAAARSDGHDWNADR